MAMAGVRARRWSSTTPTATGSSPAGSASTRAPSASARWRPGLRRRHRPPGAADARPPAARCSAARPPTRCTSPQGCARPGIDPRELALEIGMFGAEPWTERDARRDRAPSSACARSTSTACPRSSGRASPASAPRHATACTSARTTSSSRSSTPRPASRCPTAIDGELVFTTPDQGGDAAAALPHRRHRVAEPRAVRVRPHASRA